MKYFVGLDVSLKEISMCVVDDEGHVVFRRSLPFCPLAVRDALEEQKVVPQRIVHESGQISIWLQRQLEDLGLRADKHQFEPVIRKIVRKGLCLCDIGKVLAQINAGIAAFGIDQTVSRDG